MDIKLLINITNMFLLKMRQQTNCKIFLKNSSLHFLTAPSTHFEHHQKQTNNQNSKQDTYVFSRNKLQKPILTILDENALFNFRSFDHNKIHIH